MALSNINVGTVANDGTGDSIRAAFQKINANNAQFKTVALSGAYSDLTGSPILAAVATSGAYADLSGKPALATVATSGAYSDLSGTPVKNNSTASDPTVNSDSSAGYAAGSQWTNTSTFRRFLCTSAAVGAAIWDILDSAVQPGYVANRWYAATPQPASTAGTTIPALTMGLVPVVFTERVTIDQLAGRVATSSAGGNFQMAIYAADPTTFNPTGNALATTASLSTNSGGGLAGALNANLQVEPGKLYWVATMADNTTAAFAVIPAGGSLVQYYRGAANLSSIFTNSSAVMACLTTSYTTFGTWPSLTSATFTEDSNSRYAMPAFHVTSVP